jgi:hypothetical protein
MLSRILDARSEERNPVQRTTGITLKMNENDLTNFGMRDLRFSIERWLGRKNSV